MLQNSTAKWHTVKRIYDDEKIFLYKNYYTYLVQIIISLTLLSQRKTNFNIKASTSYTFTIKYIFVELLKLYIFVIYTVFTYKWQQV